MKKDRGFICRTAGNEEISAALYCGCLVWGFFYASDFTVAETSAIFTATSAAFSSDFTGMHS